MTDLTPASRVPQPLARGTRVYFSRTDPHRGGTLGVVVRDRPAQYRAATGRHEPLYDVRIYTEGQPAVCADERCPSRQERYAPGCPLCGLVCWRDWLEPIPPDDLATLVGLGMIADLETFPDPRQPAPE